MDSDDGISSEDLLRQARQDLGVDAPTQGVDPLSPQVPATESPATEPSMPPASVTPPPPAPQGLSVPGHGVPPSVPPQPAAPRHPGHGQPPPSFPDQRFGAPAPPPSVPGPPRGLPYVPPKKRRIRLGPIIGVALFGGFLLIGFLTTRGTTSASRIDVGDCFEDPGFGDFTRVTDQDCALPHDIQVYAEVDYDPTATFSDGTPACEEAIVSVFNSVYMFENNDSIVLPDDTLMNELSEGEPGGKVLCILESPSGGLVGSVLPD